MDNYASFISEALEKTKCRECVPSWEEIQMLMNRQEMLCTVHYPGPGSCQLYISSHTTATEVCPPSGQVLAKTSQLFLLTRTVCHCERMCLFTFPPGGPQDTGEARPAGEPQHVCAVRAERAVGAAGGRGRSDRRHPDQVGEEKVSGTKMSSSAC